MGGAVVEDKGRYSSAIIRALYSTDGGRAGRGARDILRRYNRGGARHF